MENNLLLNEQESLEINLMFGVHYQLTDKQEKALLIYEDQQNEANYERSGYGEGEL